LAHALKACVVTVTGNQPSCGVCGRKLVKNGSTSAGRTRWRCKHCGASSTQRRLDITRKAEFTAFIDWLTGTGRQSGSGMAERTFRHRTAWCWNVIPRAARTGEVHPQLLLDGTYFNGWCVLVAYTRSRVIDWQWCDREKHASWSALLARIPAPTVAVVDGHGGLLSAIKEHWPDTTIQRCLFHIRQGTHRHLTRTPTLPAGKELLALIKALTAVKDLDAAAAWLGEYATWEATWSTFLAQRTYATDSPARPAHAKGNKKWWYTHLRLRRARGLISRIVKAGHLFTWLEHTTEDHRFDRTTSPLEGGVNAGIKQVLRDHRGLTDRHAKRAIDWYLYQRTEAAQDPWHLVTSRHWQPAPKRTKTAPPEALGPALYDTAFNWEDGNGIQQGWAGRRP